MLIHEDFIQTLDDILDQALESSDFDTAQRIVDALSALGYDP